MKQIKTIIMLLAMVLAAAGSAAALPFDKYSLNREDLPKEAQEMLTTHFPKAKVSMIKVDRHLLKKTDYDVKLVNGTKIEFNNKGKWTSVDCKKRAVPETLLKKSMTRHVTKKHPGSKIVRIKKIAAGFEVGLSSGETLRFNHLGSHTSTTAPE